MIFGGSFGEANISQFSQILAVVAETTGDVSVLHAEGDVRSIQPELLEDVIAGDRYGQVAGYKI